MPYFPINNVHRWFTYRLGRTNLPEWFITEYENSSKLTRIAQWIFRQETFNEIVSDQFNDLWAALTELSDQVNLLSESLTGYVTNTSLASTLEDYSTTSSIASTYVTQSTATATYLAKSVATTTYLKIADADTTYLKIADAADEYVDGASFGTFAGTVFSSLGAKWDQTAGLAYVDGKIADQGLPPGGTTGQTLEKVSGTDYDATWA